MKVLSWSALALLAILCLSGCDNLFGPGKDDESTKKAAVSITVDSLPILMEWSYYSELWYMTPRVAVSESNGVDVSITSARLVFVYNDKYYAEQDFGGGQLRGNSTRVFNLEIGTKYYYDKVRFTIAGTDANGYKVSVSQLYDLHYVGED